MVSAPSVRKRRRAEAQAARGSRRQRWAPLLRIAVAALSLLVVIGAVMAVRSALADPQARGREALVAGDYRSARVDLTSVVAAEPDNGVAHRDLARALIGLGRGAEAERHVLRARDLGLGQAATRADLAEALLLQGRTADALAALNGPLVAADRRRAARIAGEARYRAGDPAAARRAFAAAVANGGDAPGWIAFARFRLAEQDMLGADAAADAARRAAPGNAAAWAVKADVVRARGGPVAALPWYDAALALQPDAVPVLLEQAAALGEAGRARDMLVPLRRAAGLEPANPRALFLQAAVAARGGEPALARVLLSRIGGADADLPAVLLLRSAVELSLDTPVAAAQQAARLLAIQPDNVAARRLLAAALAEADNPRGAIEVLDPITTRADADGWSLLLLGRAFGAIGWQDDAVPPLERAATLTRGSAPPLGGDVDGGDTLDPAVAVPTIRARLTNGQADAALALATRLAEANPGVAEARLLAGDAALASGDAAAAASHFRIAAGLRFDEPTMLRLVNAAQVAGDRAGAGDALAQFMARWPQNVAAMRVAAAFAVEQGDWGRARDFLLAANARIGPNDALLLAQIARSELELGDAAAAQPFAERAYRLLPGNATISGVYGLALARSGGDQQDPRDLLAKAVQLAPGDRLLQQWRAEVGR